MLPGVLQFILRTSRSTSHTSPASYRARSPLGSVRGTVQVMPILQEDIARVREAVDLVELIGERAALKRQGRRWVGLCPFHSEKTPSFSVNAEEGLYYCFGCQASGDAITFVRETEGLDFQEAVEALADRAGVVLRYEEVHVGPRERGRQELLEAMSAAVAWYHARLQSAPDAARARAYLRSRGYDADIVRFFQLGWAPESWDALCSSLDLPEQVLLATGLGFVNRIGKKQDAFSGRIVFPIFDPVGRAVAMGGRVLPEALSTPAPTVDRSAAGLNASGRSSTQASEDLRNPAARRVRGNRDEPKYKNSPETAIYSKRRTLYGLNWAKDEAVRAGEVIVCEGYTDVIGFFQVGLRRAVATCGTSLTEDHLKLLARFAPRVVFAYDADAAGRSGMERVYEWERLNDLDIRVAVLPSGSDPGDLAARDPDTLRRAVETARPLLAVRVDQALSGADLHSAEGRAKAAEVALGVVAGHPSDLVRDQYVMAIADHCRMEPADLRERLARKQRFADPRRNGSQGSAKSGIAMRTVANTAENGGAQEGSFAPVQRDMRPTRSATRPSDRAPVRRPERASAVVMEALRLVVHRRGEMINRLEAVLFPPGIQRDAFRALVAHRDVREAADTAAPAVADLLRRLVVEEPSASAEDVLTRLVEAGARKALVELEAEARSSEASFDEVAAVAAQVRLSIEELYDSDNAGMTRDLLLAWLVAREDGEED